MCAREVTLSPQVLKSPEFRRACTHPSAGSEHYECQEFLGDALLGWIITEYLYAHFSELPEGDLTRMRSHLVCRPMLSQLACETGLGDHVVVDPRQKFSEHARNILKGNALEAIIAAVYQVEGMGRVREFVLELYGAHLQQLSGAQALVNAKTRLQECLAAQGHQPPYYEKIAEMREQSPRFEVRCVVSKLDLSACGRGERIRDAEKDAAAHMLEEIQKRWPEWLN